MNAKILAICLSGAAILTAISWGASSAQVPVTKGTAAVQGQVSGLAKVRAQLILRRSSYALPAALGQPAMLANLRALQHPATADFEPGGTNISARWTKRINATLGSDPVTGQATRSPQALAQDPKVIATMKRFSVWQQGRRASLLKVQQDYVRVFGKAPRRLPTPASPFDAVLRIHNDSATALTLWDKSDLQKVKMRLTGPGAVSILAAVDGREHFVMGVKLVLPPGGHVDVPFTDLSFGNRATQLAAYATAPGRYTLGLEWSTMSTSNPSGNARQVRTPLTITFPPVTFDVVK